MVTPIVKNKNLNGVNYYPATATNARLQQYLSYKKGWLICFGMDTFWGYIFTSFDNGTAAPNPNVFNIADVDVEQWAIEAAAAGVDYAIITTKSEAGHVIWPTQATYDGPNATVTQSTGPSWSSPAYRVNNVAGFADENILTKFVQEFTSRGIEVGAYFSNATDWNLLGGYVANAPMNVNYAVRNAAVDYYCLLVKELVRDYGFTMIWMDHYTALSEGENQRIYNAIKEENQDCLVIGNDHGQTTTQRFPCDIQSTEAGLFIDGVTGYKTTSRTWKGQTFYIPQEIVFTPAQNYQYYIYDASCVTQGPYTNPPTWELQATIQGWANEGRNYGCPILMTVMVDRAGVINATNLTMVNAVTGLD